MGHRWIFVLVVLFVGGATAVAGAGDRPNVVVIISDDAGYADFSFHGSDEIRTPNLDATPFEGGVRVPFLAAGRTGSRAGRPTTCR